MVKSLVFMMLMAASAQAVDVRLPFTQCDGSREGDVRTVSIKVIVDGDETVFVVSETGVPNRKYQIKGVTAGNGKIEAQAQPIVKNQYTMYGTLKVSKQLMRSGRKHYFGEWSLKSIHIDYENDAMGSWTSFNVICY